jgi:hypothetical protein
VSAWKQGGGEEREGVRGKGGDEGKGGEMTQTLYVHMNKRYFFQNKKNKTIEATQSIMKVSGYIGTQINNLTFQVIKSIR